MMKTHILIVSLLFMALMINAAEGASDMNRRSFALLRMLHDDAQGKNVVISYYSIAQAMGMTELGAKGQTAQELRDYLGLSPKREFFLEWNKTFEKYNKIKLLTANRIWIQADETVRPDFTASLKRYFASGVDYADFAKDSDNVKVQINAFVSKSTQKMIQELLDSRYVFGRDTMLFLVNAIYFKADWETAFDAKATHEGLFKYQDGTSQKVNFMHGSGMMDYLENKRLGYSAVAIPYKQQGLFYIALLPDEATTIDELSGRLAGHGISNLFKSGFTKERVDLEMPRLLIHSFYSLVPAFKKLGLEKPFAPDADFSGIADGVFISEILHAATFEMNEKGSSAAAATSVKMTRGVSIAKKFHADKPFIGLIYDKTSDVILFSMVVNNPALR